jgi:hypothetical protein
MRASAMPGEDPMTLKTPEEVADSIVALCLPSITDSGRLYDVRSGRMLDYRPPA